MGKGKEIMDEHAKGFTAGLGCAIRYMFLEQKQYGKYLFDESNIPLADFEKYCDVGDFKYIKEAAEY